MKTTIKNVPGMGRGVIANKDLRKGETVEVAPVLVMTKYEHSILSSTILNSYVYAWDDRKGSVAIAFGIGSLFNHDDNSNVTYALNLKDKTIKYTATRSIKKGEQLFIDYGYNPMES